MYIYPWDSAGGAEVETTWVGCKEKDHLGVLPLGFHGRYRSRNHSGGVQGVGPRGVRGWIPKFMEVETQGCGGEVVTSLLVLGPALPLYCSLGS